MCLCNEMRMQRVFGLNTIIDGRALSSSTMKRQPSRAPSPTPTAFSGISTYRNDSYRARTKDVPALPIDYRSVSRTHFDELNRYLADYLAKGPVNVNHLIEHMLMHSKQHLLIPGQLHARNSRDSLSSSSTNSRPMFMMNSFAGNRETKVR